MSRLLISIEPPNVYANGKLIGYVRNVRMQNCGKDVNEFNTADHTEGFYGNTRRCFRTLDLDIEKIADELPPAVHQILQPPKIRERSIPLEQPELNLNI